MCANYIIGIFCVFLKGMNNIVEHASCEYTWVEFQILHIKILQMDETQLLENYKFRCLVLLV